MDHADLHGGGLRAEDGREAEAAGERRRACDEAAPRNGRVDLLFHGEAPSSVPERATLR
jgi:hypothetical protein